MSEFHSRLSFKQEIDEIVQEREREKNREILVDSLDHRSIELNANLSPTTFLFLLLEKRMTRV